MTTPPRCSVGHVAVDSCSDTAAPAPHWSAVEREDPRTVEILTVLNDVFDAFTDFATAGPQDSKLRLTPV